MYRKSESNLYNLYASRGGETLAGGIKKWSKAFRGGNHLGLFHQKVQQEVYPWSNKDKLALEFQKLKQELMIVNQYHVKFTQLSRFVGKLVAEKEERIEI